DHSGSPGVYVRNFVFVPGYNGNASDVSPYGVYAATKLRAAGSWINNANFSYDVGFVTVGGQTQGPKKGALVANAQGSQGLGFNLARHKYVENFGYPAASPYNGKVVDYSAGYALNADENGSAAGNTVAKDDPDGSNDQVVNSNLTGGSSGGPWFYDFNESTGGGTQVSVNSFSYVGLTAAQQREYKIPKYNMWGPYFGTGIENLFDAVQGPPPKATSKSVTTPEDTSVKITLSGTKSVSYDPTPLKFIIKTRPAHGTLTRSGNVVTYKPNLNYNGTDKFTYVANNGINNSAPATVNIKITAVAG
ncbi:MAG: cadherin-like domain-containing protein, partial [Microlunatus sp.]|nr:cadherin-like domain-containing protein [Microlunatus sp.]